MIWKQQRAKLILSMREVPRHTSSLKCKDSGQSIIDAFSFEVSHVKLDELNIIARPIVRNMTWKKTKPILAKFLAATPEALQGAQRRLQQALPAQQSA
jgi:hypothetical protein